ncbi:hypothetical protein [Diplocloster agilis]|uniref:Uncharacterized protein n=1 Tax=Diplocloster agilis TaxID=2850323 RepID=A0A949K7D7_9FIRM|nr:hypothetical protein [Diplocloster agilis]MBU9739326.1 hypothetical protein [Diplocloster agilis]
MAYQAKRRKRYEEDFELCDEEGKVVKTLHVSLDVDDVIGKIYRKYADLTKVLAETSEMKRKSESGEIVENCIERLGNAVVNLFEAVFGPEDAGEIVSFYDNRYAEMCKEVVPFITQVVVPRCSDIKKENQKSILQGYNRKQRRHMFK